MINRKPILKRVVVIWLFELLLHTLLITAVFSSTLLLNSIDRETIITLSAPIWLFSIILVGRINFPRLFNRNINGFRFTTYSCRVVSGEREKLDEVRFENIKTIYRKWLIRSTIWSVITLIIYIIIRNWLQLQSIEFEFHILPAIFILVSTLNLLYTLSFNRDIHICPYR